MTSRTSGAAASREIVKQFLREQVGEGGEFSMQELRDYAPNVNQIDRRMRELRELGWVIDTSNSDPSLRPGVYRFTAEGAGTSVRPVVNARVRRQVFERDQNRCVLCGTSAGQPYADEPSRACRLTVGHLQARSQGGSDSLSNYRTECARCNEPARNRTSTPPSIEEMVAQAMALDRASKRRLAAWLANGTRDFSPVEDLFARLIVLPPDHREAVLEALSRFRD